MVKLIVGEKGKGKTKKLLDMVNSRVKELNGNIVYLDKVRLIDVSQYMLESGAEFAGFVSGIISQDHDLQEMYFDSFLKIAHLENEDIVGTVQKLEKIGEAFHVNFILSVSMDESKLPEALKDKIEISL